MLNYVKNCSIPRMACFLLEKLLFEIQVETTGAGKSFLDAIDILDLPGAFLHGIQTGEAFDVAGVGAAAAAEDRDVEALVDLKHRRGKRRGLFGL